jgi:lipopolysaccharide transport system permease protein
MSLLLIERRCNHKDDVQSSACSPKLERRIMFKRLRALIQRHELIETLVMRDLKLRYKNSVIGFLWSLMNPLLLMVIFTIVFTVLIPSTNIRHFPVFVLTALFSWNFFSTALMSGINSIVDNGHLIKKVSFPPEILTISTVLANCINFILAIPILIVFIVLFNIPLTLSLFYVPIIILLQVAFTLGVAFFLATLQVFFRDTGHIMEVLIQAWFMLTPIFYSSTLIPEWRTVLGVALPVRRLSYILNPMASIVTMYRSVVYGFPEGSPPIAPELGFFLRTAVTTVVVLMLGYWFFIRHSRRFGEEV